MPAMPRIETFRAQRTLYTSHPADRYPGFHVFQAPHWKELRLICANPGQSFVALGGERVYAYETQGGVKAEAFTLNPGDRATFVSDQQPAFLAEWRIERAD